MATVTGYTAERMQEIEDGTIVSGVINGSGDLILTRHDGGTVNAGPVLGTVPDASDTVKGIVELATSSETAALTDTTRAVTPGGLAATINGLDTRLDTLEALPGSKVQSITAPAESASYSSYPTGISIAYVGSGSGWSLNSGFGSIVTVNQNSDRCVQTFYTNDGGSAIPKSWFRTYHSSGGGGGWTAWTQIHSGPALALMDLVYPVGSIYMSTVSTSPATLFGIGTWVAIEGKFLIGADGTYTNGSTGGAATKTLTTTELPAHTHGAGTYSAVSNGSHVHSLGEDQDGANGNTEWINHSTGITGSERNYSNAMTSAGAHTHTLTGSSASAGTGSAFSMLPPYLSVYIWKRTA